MRRWSAHAGLLTLVALLHVAARNEASTDVTVGVGGGSFEYVPGGCGSYHRGAEIAAFGSVRREFEGHLAVDGSLTLAPGWTQVTSVTGSGAVVDEGSHPHFIGALSGRIGGRWPWIDFMVGPEIFYHPQIGGPVPLPSAELKLGPDPIYAWGTFMAQPAWSLWAGNVQTGLGTRGRLGELELGILAPVDAPPGPLARGQAVLPGGWRLGGEVGVNDVSSLPGPDWRVMALVTKRLPARQETANP